MRAERTLRALEGLPGLGAVHLLCRAETTGVERLPPLVVITGTVTPGPRRYPAPWCTRHLSFQAPKTEACDSRLESLQLPSLSPDCSYSS